MLRNQIKYAIRILLKDGIYSLLNVLGLTLGISVGIILFLYLQSEFSYDTHHEKANQIYRLSVHLQAQGADFNTARTARELAPALKAELPEIIDYVRFNDYARTLVSTEQEGKVPVQFYEEGIFEADSSFLSVFTHEVLAGNSEGCLSGPGKVVLTASIAQKYFGDQSPIGKTIKIGANEQRQVTAVISDLPDNSHLKYSILLSEIPERWGLGPDATAQRLSERYWNPGIYTYLLLPVDYDVAQFPANFKASVFDKYFRPFADRIEGTATPRLQALTDIHFGVNLDNDEPIGNINYVYAFSAIGLFLILLACINYMNLATARSMYRAGEIGVRKVLGKTRLGLFGSLLTEAMVLSVVAMMFSLIVCYIVLNLTPFNTWVDKMLTLNLLSNPPLLGGIIGITFIVGLMSGVYPALYIPSVPVVSALKGTIITQKKGAIIRKVLITLQFVISIFVIITTILMGSQIEYMKQSDLGFDIENVVLVPIHGDLGNEKIDAMKAELEAQPSVVATTTAYGVPGVDLGGQVFMTEADGGEMLQKSMFTIYCGKNYLSTSGYELVDGRDFLPGDGDIDQGILVNEAGARELGWGSNAIGKKVTYFHRNNDMKIIGVVKDFNFKSLHEKVEPMFILQSRERGGYLQVKIRGNDIAGSLAHIEQVTTRFDDENPFDYFFLDREFNEQYQADQIQQELISALSYICIFISLMGLVGLSAFTVSQKVKEISIRKTLGGSLGHILFVFSRGYVVLMLIATIIAIPVADFVMVEWLSSFAYQMPQNWWNYLLPSFMVMFFGLCTVMLQTYKAARSNPVEGLRSE